MEKFEIPKQSASIFSIFGIGIDQTNIQSKSVRIANIFPFESKHLSRKAVLRSNPIKVISHIGSIIFMFFKTDKKKTIVVHEHLYSVLEWRRALMKHAKGLSVITQIIVFSIE